MLPHDGMQRARHRVALVLAVGLGTASACTPGLPAEVTAYRIGPCDDFAIDAERVWNADTQRALSQTLSAYPADFADRTARRAQVEFDEARTSR